VGLDRLADPAATLDAIWADVLDGVSRLEAETSRTFGRGPRPLLVSVRSGATHSMPGMMDTILDVGMTDAVEQALAAEGGPQFAGDTRQRFTRMYRRVVGKPVPAARRLERLASDVQEIEFTVEDGKLWLLQTRAAERSAQAAVRLAIRLRHNGLIDDAEAAVRAAVEAGQTDVVATTPLVVMLTALRLTAGVAP
jgi:phosphoenolpyruvate synthase/pyruvate phosphate dikinase